MTAAAGVGDPNVMTARAFALRLNLKAHYGNQLLKDGRLVMAPDGKHVRFAESLARWDATRDPSKAGVSAYHEAKREAKQAAESGAMVSVAPTVDDAAPVAPVGAVVPAFEPMEPQGAELYSYQDAKAKREHWAAEREHAAWRKEAGELMERSEVVAAFADAGATLRGKLEAWASVLPPQLAGRDEAAIRATLADQVEQVLHDLVGKFNQVAGESM